MPPEAKFKVDCPFCGAGQSLGVAELYLIEVGGCLVKTCKSCRKEFYARRGPANCRRCGQRVECLFSGAALTFSIVRRVRRKKYDRNRDRKSGNVF